ncbi:MarR family winged helix-turn-helix transcriptional regulator [Bacteroides sp. 51]|uniref:MarR family winged helix-turn-helix transcriptional regulator n=1 Tax=Bacteroides sp. 51 TaxID=2302938 RepID=UPI0013D10B38|nr:MarR family winged helix-turn-helix transcriptional regulator [Bacteroides sp. 51]NDV83188.1 MarR family transcriptional regulator [Bacteroides sp. 51]
MKKKTEIPNEQLGYLLTQVSFLKQRITNAALKELDITYVQFIILAGTLELGADGGIVTQQSIASERRLDKAMVSNVVKTLIEKGFLTRQEHPEDKRAFTLRLTPAGEEKAMQGKDIARKVDHTFFAHIDHEAFRESLKQLLKNETGNHGE